MLIGIHADAIAIHGEVTSMIGPSGRRRGGSAATSRPILLPARGFDLRLVFRQRDLRVATGGARLLAARPDVVALDHLVQRRRLDVEQLGGPLLHATGGLERR